MRERLLGPLKTAAERYVPDRAKNGVRKALASRLERRLVTYRELAERPGVETWRFGESWTVEFDEPEYHNELSTEFTKLFGSHQCPRPFVLEVPDGVMFGNDGFIATAEGEYVAFNFDRVSPRHHATGELAYQVVDELTTGSWPLSVPTDGELPEIDVAVPLVHRWATNYSHWTEEWLTQVEGIRHYVDQTGRDPILVIPADPPSFVPESLEVLGYEEADYVEWDGGPVRVNRLVLPSIRRCRSNTSDDYMRDVSALRWLRDEVLDSVSLPERSESASRLLISREEDASTRRIVNWDAVEATLSERGFETVILSEIDFREQKRLFAGADVVVGTHGAGLTELLYAPRAGVVELYGDYVVPVYYEIAKGMDMPYACLRCEDVGGDIRVDVDELLTAIAAVSDEPVEPVTERDR